MPAPISTPFIDAQFFVNRFGAAEIASVLNHRLSTRLSGDDLLAQVDGNPSTVPGDADSAVMVVAWIDQYIEDAHGLVAGAIQAGYGDNFGSFDPTTLVKRIEADIARYYLYEDNPTDVVVRRYEDATTQLTEIARGKLKIGVGTSSGEKVTERPSSLIIAQPTAADTDGQAISDDDWAKFAG